MPFKEASEFTPGERVQAFHPRTLGVVHYGTVEKVGHKWITVRFTVDSHRIWKLLPYDMVRKVR